MRECGDWLLVCVAKTGQPDAQGAVEPGWLDTRKTSVFPGLGSIVQELAHRVR